MGNVLIVDSNQKTASEIAAVCSSYSPICVASADEALKIINDDIRVVLLNYDAVKGKEHLKQIIDFGLIVSVIAYMPDKSHDPVVEAMKAGAYYCFTAPYSRVEIENKIDNAANKNTMQLKVQQLFDQKAAKELSYKSSMEILKKLAPLRMLQGRSVENKEMAYLVPIDRITDPDLAEFKNNIEAMRKAESTYASDKPTVMIVDDEESILANLTYALKKYYNLVLASHPTDALKKAKELDTIDIFILDIHLPEKTGDVLMPELKAIHPEAEVIIITGFRETEKAVNLLHKGAYTYINKPCDNFMLRSAVHDAIQFKYLKNFLKELGQGPKFKNKTQQLIDQINEFAAFYAEQIKAGKPVFIRDLYRIIPSIVSKSFFAEPLALDHQLPNDINPKDMLNWLAYRFGPRY